MTPADHDRMTAYTWNDGERFGPIESSIVWHPMRPTVDCAKCGRRGAIQRRCGVTPFVTHTCPGPFVLSHVVRDPQVWRATFFVRLFAPVQPVQLP